MYNSPDFTGNISSNTGEWIFRGCQAALVTLLNYGKLLLAPSTKSSLPRWQLATTVQILGGSKGKRETSKAKIQNLGSKGKQRIKSESVRPISVLTSNLGVCKRWGCKVNVIHRQGRHFQPGGEGWGCHRCRERNSRRESIQLTVY